MAITNGYCTLAEVKAVLRIATADVTSDTLLEKEVETASRRVDSHCGRFFYSLAATAVDFYPDSYRRATLPADLTTITSLKTDTAGDGTFATTWAAADYQLQPQTFALQSRPYTHVIGLKRTFPWLSSGAAGIRVTGTWGWSAIPTDVRGATILLAIRGFARLNAALGVVGSDETIIQVRPFDPDVNDMLRPYVLMGVA